METMDAEPPSQHEKDLWKINADNLPEDILHEIYEKAAEVSTYSLLTKSISSLKSMHLQLKGLHIFSGSHKLDLHKRELISH